MSYSVFGASSSLASYVSVETAFSVAPSRADVTPASVHAQLGEVLAAAEGVAAVSVAVLADADTRPAPPAPATLQELIAAGRARLLQERSRVDRDRDRAAVTHLTRLRELVLA